MKYIWHLISERMNSDTTYPVMEHFPTLQGEGKFTGSAAYFIRLGGCDVGCHWCDIKDSWPLEGYERMTAAQLAKIALDSGLQMVVVTGGEPAMYDLASLTTALREAGLTVHLETSGAHPITGEWDWITFSPKKFKSPLPSSAGLANELKVVIFHRSDFEFAEQHAQTISEHCELYLQPEWDKSEHMMPLILDYIQAHPKWQLSLQTHKYLNIP